MRKAILHTVATRAIALVLTLVTSVLTARLFLPDGKADIALFSLAVALFVALLGFGTPASATHYSARNEMDVVRLAGIVLCQIMLGILLCFVLLTTAPDKSLFGLLPRPQGLFFPILLIVAVTVVLAKQMTAALLLAELAFLKLNYLNLAMPVATLMLTASLFLAHVEPEQAVEVFLIFSQVFSILIVGVSFVLLLRKRRSRPPPKSTVPLAQFLGYGGQSAASDFVQLLAYRIDIWIVYYFLDKDHLGQYVLAVGLAQMLWLLPGAISSIVFPNTSSGNQELGALIRWARIALGISTIAAVIGGMLAPWLIPFLYGPEYHLTPIAFVLLLPGTLTFVLCKVFASYLAGIGKIRINLVASLVGCVVGIAFDFMLIPWLGIAGASIASSLSYFATTCIVFYFLVRATGIGPFRLLVGYGPLPKMC